MADTRPAIARSNGGREDAIPSRGLSQTGGQSRGGVCYTSPWTNVARPGAPRRGEVLAMASVIGVILLIAGILAAAGLAIAVTRWALHMNGEE